MQTNLTVQVQFNCGCGFLTASQKEALTHVTEMKHSMKIAGMIWADKTPKVVMNART